MPEFAFGRDAKAQIHVMHSVLPGLVAGGGAERVRRAGRRCAGRLVLARWQWPESGPGCLACLLVAAFGAVGHGAATTAHRRADVSIPAPVIHVHIHVRIFLAALSGILPFDTWPTIRTPGGGLFIIAAGLHFLQWNRKVRGRARRPVPATG